MADYVKISGKLKWARLVKPEEFDGEKHWKVTIYPDAGSLDLVHELIRQGIKNVLKKDDDGYYISFKRPTERDFGGEVRSFDPPKVTDKEGKDLDVLVGNGTEAIVTLETYGFKKRPGKAARLHSVTVTELVPYIQNS